MICFADLSIDEMHTMVLTNACTCVCKCMWLHLTNNFTLLFMEDKVPILSHLNQFIDLF